MTTTTKYFPVPAMMGWAIVMDGPEGRMAVEVGIKSWNAAVRKAERWEKQEAAAQKKAAKATR